MPDDVISIAYEIWLRLLIALITVIEHSVLYVSIQTLNIDQNDGWDKFYKHWKFQVKTRKGGGEMLQNVIFLRTSEFQKP